ncbi:MAG: hypothetical protein CBC36_04715 [Verrucomicrobiaceae bacterium TMED76]|nr:MAG: hypothetical protein CBC36_04715 [Verrucomicrobiaceae bacterium TMED76]
MDKKKIAEETEKILEYAKRESDSVIKASKPIAKKWLGKLSDKLVELGEKGQKALKEEHEDQKNK